MDPDKVLYVGDKTTKKTLSKALSQPNLALVREGIFHCKNSSASLFFCDLEKKGKEERFHFNDFFEDEMFHWDSQTTQHLNSPKIQEIVTGERIPHLFARIHSKIKGITQPFIYCGRLRYIDYVRGTYKPVHMFFESLDYVSEPGEDLRNLYMWRPSGFQIETNHIGELENKARRLSLSKPSKTVRLGKAIQRVGQDYFKQQLLSKWDGKCALTGCSDVRVLRASHIVPWSESNDSQRLDSDNGILLSPMYDALFDQHLISFDDQGSMIISSSLSDYNITCLALDRNLVIKLSDGMIKYLVSHRAKFSQKQKKNRANNTK